MNIYLLSQHTYRGYDTYDSCVVIAPDEGAARSIHPAGGLVWMNGDWCVEDTYLSLRPPMRLGRRDWPAPDDVVVVLIGVASPEQNSGVVCASYHSG